MLFTDQAGNSDNETNKASTCRPIVRGTSLSLSKMLCLEVVFAIRKRYWKMESARFSSVAIFLK